MVTTEWQHLPFRQLLAEPVRNGIYKPKEFHGSGAKIVNMGELFAHSRLYNVPMKRVELSSSEQERFTIQKGDLLFARRSLVAEGAGKCSVVLDVEEPTTFESSIIRARPDPSKANSLYLYYFFNSPQGLHCLDTIRRQVAVAGITGTDLARLEVQVPPLSEQLAIAETLDALDDKIELNRRMKATLLDTAQILFKSWFTRFDPVRAKSAGGSANFPDRVRDLFPTSFVNSEIGQIPEGWQVLSLDQIANFLNGLVLQKYPAQENRSLPAIKIAQLRSGSTDRADRVSAAIDPSYIIHDGDIIFSWSGSLECVMWAGGPGALNQHLFKVTSDLYPRWLCYLGVLSHIEGFRHIAAGKATTMGHIQRRHLSEAKLPVPPRNQLVAMGSFLAPLVESIWRRDVQSRTLAELRTALLPVLISGQVRTKATEILSEE